MSQESPFSLRGQPVDPDAPIIEIVPLPPGTPPPPEAPGETPAPPRRLGVLALLVPAAIVAALVVAAVATTFGLVNRIGDEMPAISERDAGGVVLTPSSSAVTAPPSTETTTSTTSTAPTTAVPTTAPPSTAPPTTSPPPSPTAGWVAYAAPDGSFTALLPAAPRVEVGTALTPTGSARRTLYTVGVGPTRRMVLDVTASAVPVGRADEYLLLAAGTTAGQLGGTLADMTRAVDGPRTFLDYRVSYRGGVMFVRSIVVGSTLHYVTVSSVVPDADPAETSRLMAGLRDHYVAASL